MTMEDTGVIGYPAEFRERYREAGVWNGSTLPGLLEDAARRFGDAPFVSDRDRTLSFRGLSAVAHRVAAWLHGLGIDPGDNVVLYLPNSVRWMELYFGVLRAGARPVLCLHTHGSVELAHVARAAGATLICTTGRVGARDYASLADQAAGRVKGDGRDVMVAEIALSGAAPWDDAPDGAASPDPDPCGVAVLQLSGGTTGAPKLIPRLHDEYAYGARSAVEVTGLDRGSVMLIVLPVAHNFVMTSPGFLGALQVGARVILAPDPSPVTGFGIVERERVTHLALVPPLLLTWLNSPEIRERDTSSLVAIWVGGAKLSPEVARRVHPELGCALQQVFGMAEGLCNFTRLDDDEETVIGTQGRPASPLDEVRVVDDAGNPVPDGVEGHLQVRGPYTIRGYYQAPEHNARSFTPDGFYISGDIVVRDSRGYLTVTGRAKDIINRGGEKIAPSTVEDCFLSHPGVHDVSVVGRSDEHLGERIIAHVVLRADLPEGARVDRKALRMHLIRQGLAPFSIPDEILIVDELPLTAVGKVAKRQQ